MDWDFRERHWSRYGNILGLENALGFLVITVVEDSPAWDAGLIGSDKTIEVEGREYAIGGDVITAVDGIDVRKIDDILIHLQRVKTVGDEMNLEILRGDRSTNVTIILQERPNWKKIDTSINTSTKKFF